MTRTRKPSGQHKRKSRTRNQQKSGDIILIVCEGKETEPTYFKSLKRKLRIPATQVMVLKKKSGWDPLYLVETAFGQKETVEKQDKIEIDEVWCVFDHEGCNKHPTFDKAIDFANRNNVKVAVSFPCFEFWFLLHYISTTKPFSTCKDVTKELKKHIPNYKKSEDYFDTLLPHIERAIERAEKVRKHSQKSNSICPATDVDKLVDRINKLSRYPIIN